MKPLLLSIALLIALTAELSAAIFYASPSGNNSNPGTNELPFQSVQYALDQMQAGDVLRLYGGVYNEKFYLPISNLSIEAVANEVPIIDASGRSNQVAIIEIYFVEGTRISGLEIRNNIMPDAQGVLIEGLCSNTIIENCRIHDIHFSPDEEDEVNEETNAQAIIVYGNTQEAISNLRISQCEIFDCRLGFSEALAINGNVDGFELIGNHIHHNTNIGIDIIGFELTAPNPSIDQARNGTLAYNHVHHNVATYATSAGIYVDGGANLKIYNNAVHHNGFGIEVGCENINRAASNVLIVNNIIYNNNNAGLALGGYDYPDGSGKVEGLIVRNNSTYKNDQLNNFVGEILLSHTENTLIYNNVFYSNEQDIFCYEDISSLNLHLHHNAYWSDSGAPLVFDLQLAYLEGLSDVQSATNWGEGSLETDPQYLNPESDIVSLRLNPTSLCIDAGEPPLELLLNELDFDGEPRINENIDMGSDEYYSDTVILSFENPRKGIKIYPNPGNSFELQTLDNTASLDLELFDIQGKSVLKRTAFAFGQSVNCDHLPSGIYLVFITLEKDLHTLVWRKSTGLD